MTALSMPQPGRNGAVTAGTVRDAIHALAPEPRGEDAPRRGSTAPASLAFGPGIPVPTTRIRRWSGPRVFP